MRTATMAAPADTMTKATSPNPLCISCGGGQPGATSHRKRAPKASEENSDRFAISVAPIAQTLGGSAVSPAVGAVSPRPMGSGP